MTTCCDQCMAADYDICVDSACACHEDPDRFCQSCGADILGNDPHLPDCSLEAAHA